MERIIGGKDDEVVVDQAACEQDTAARLPPVIKVRINRLTRIALVVLAVSSGIDLHHHAAAEIVIAVLTAPARQRPEDCRLWIVLLLLGRARVNVFLFTLLLRRERVGEEQGKEKS